jgi:hypothetical protein
MARYMSCADTAKEVRKALKAEFPGVRFSVRSHTYSGGASIDVSWRDGPTYGSVNAVCQRFAGASFDGMIDLKTTHTTLVMNPDGTPEEVRYASDYVFAHRYITPEFRAQVTAEYVAQWGREPDFDRCNANNTDHYHFNKLLGETVGPLRKETSYIGGGEG